MDETYESVAAELKAAVARQEMPLNVAAWTLLGWMQQRDIGITLLGAQTMVDPNGLSSNKREQPMNEPSEPPLEELP